MRYVESVIYSLAVHVYMYEKRISGTEIEGNLYQYKTSLIGFMERVIEHLHISVATL